MKPTHLLAGLFVAAAVAFDLAAASRLSAASEPALMVLCGAGLGQLALLSAWCVWGTTPWLCRLLAVLASSAALSVPLATGTTGRQCEWCLVLCLYAAVVGLPLAGARSLGLRATHNEDRTGRPRALCPGQYSLAGLMSLMTVVALLCGLRDHVAFPRPHAAALASYGVCAACVALGAVWAMSSGQRCHLRIGVLCLLCLLAGPAMLHTELARSAWFFTALASIEAATICLGMQVWLMSGGGLHWSPGRP